MSFTEGIGALRNVTFLIFMKNMQKSLTAIAHQLKSADKKVQLIYAFNGSGENPTFTRTKES